MLREFIRHSLALLTEIRLANDFSGGKPVYRAIEVSDINNKVQGWYIRVPIDVSLNDVDKFIKDDPRFRKRFATPPKNGSPHEYFANARPSQSVVVNTDEQTIDLDNAKWTKFLSRRRGKANKFGNYSRTHTMPTADVSYESVGNFKKMLKQLVKDDDRITAEYRVIGNPQYEDMAVSDVLAMQPESDIVKGGAFQPMTFYHGTSEKRSQLILKKGMKPGNAPEVYVDMIPDYSEHNLYLTNSIAQAENYATRAAVDDRSKAVVLKVIVRDPAKFVIDEDQAGRVIAKNTDGEEESVSFHDRRWRKWSNAAEIYQLFQRKTLRGLTKGNTIAYKGAIPAKDISVDHTYKPASMSKDPSDTEYWTAMEKTRGSIKKGSGPKANGKPSQPNKEAPATSSGPLRKVYGPPGITKATKGSKVAFRQMGDDLEVRDPDGNWVQTWKRL